MSPSRGVLLASLLAAGSFCLVFWGVFVKLVNDWANDGNYSHGFLIIPLALYLGWERRHKLTAVEPRPSWLGLVVVLGSFGVLLMGLLGAELFLSRIAIIGVVGGSVLYLLGWRHLRILAFPIGCLLLMIPIPAIIFNHISFPLQLLASKFGVSTMASVGVPVLRDGNIIVLPHTTLEVAEACSGIRSLVSLLTLGIVYGYFSDPRGGVRVAIALATVPVAIVANGLRVAGTGIAAHFYGPEAADGFFHTFSGWIVFVAAFLMLFIIVSAVTWFFPKRLAFQQAGAL